MMFKLKPGFYTACTGPGTTWNNKTDDDDDDDDDDDNDNNNNNNEMSFGMNHASSAGLMA